MARLIYSAIASLDGYVNDEDGRFDWSAPDEEVHAFVNDAERPIGTYLYGRRMYDVMAVWQTMPTGDDESSATNDYAQIWRAAEKVVYSRTLDAPRTPRTRIERDFDAAAVRAMKEGATADLSVGGAELAGQALRAGLVDEVSLLLSPIAVGGGTPALPHGARVHLELLDQRRFGNGVVYVRYETRG
jgi:dihydrofolate reductase